MKLFKSYFLKTQVFNNNQFNSSQQLNPTTTTPTITHTQAKIGDYQQQPQLIIMYSITIQRHHVMIIQLSIIHQLSIYIYHEHVNLSSTIQLSTN